MNATLLLTLAHGDHPDPAWAATAPIAAGLVAGALHVVSGPDHLAAVAPLAVDGRRRGWLTGLWWGVGHSSGVWVLAALALAFREAIPIDLLSGWSERLVGVVLLGVGLWALRAALRTRVHTHEHTHEGVTHRHVHAHPARGDHDHATAHAAHAHAPLGIGLLHGIAGTSHLVGVLPSLLMPTRAAAVLYVLAYGFGSIAAMTGFAHALALLTRGLAERGTHALRALLAATGLAALGVGAWWIVGG
jgi:ABC-type nickel/cobalt efflux system permease component RcnA